MLTGHRPDYSSQDNRPLVPAERAQREAVRGVSGLTGRISGTSCLCFGARELGVVETGVRPVEGEKFVVVARFDDLTVLHDEDDVSVADRRESMCDHEAGA